MFTLRQQMSHKIRMICLTKEEREEKQVYIVKCPPDTLAKSCLTLVY
jgi:hypothetical protein